MFSVHHFRAKTKNESFEMNENGVERKCGAWFSVQQRTIDLRNAALAWIADGQIVVGYGLTIAVMNA
jgi:hypothetical protein